MRWLHFKKKNTFQNDEYSVIVNNIRCHLKRMILYRRRLCRRDRHRRSYLVVASFFPGPESNSQRD